MEVARPARAIGADFRRQAAIAAHRLHAARPTEAMFKFFAIPAQQLQSACSRYAGPWPQALGQRGGNSPAAGALLPVAPSADSPIAAEDDLARLESILLLAREPLTSRKLSQYANLADGTQARTLVRRLNEQYDAAGRAFRVEHVAGGYQLLTRPALAPWLRRLAHVPGETRLSAPALETLAVIAYRQPVPRADIEAIRGVNCGEILRQLMDRELVRIGGRSEELGRPYLYATTKRFLELFGLNQIDELPRAQELRQGPLPAVTNPTAVLHESLPRSESPSESNAGPIDETQSESTFG
jgi:segregation and condensation protein B